MAQTSIAPGGAIFTETFTGTSISAVHGLMDARQQELEAQGHSSFTRRKIGRNALCPCGSRLKFKKCCLARSRRN